MERAWGRPWQVQAAQSLHRWAQAIGDVPYLALWAAVTVVQLFAERTVFDLLTVLTLEPDPGHPRWSVIPGAVYAVDASQIRPVLQAVKPPPSAAGGDLLLAFTASGARVWSAVDNAWTGEPQQELGAAYQAVITSARARGWHDREPRQRQ